MGEVEKTIRARRRDQYGTLDARSAGRDRRLERPLRIDANLFDSGPPASLQFSPAPDLDFDACLKANEGALLGQYLFAVPSEIPSTTLDGEHSPIGTDAEQVDEIIQIYPAPRVGIIMFYFVNDPTF